MDTHSWKSIRVVGPLIATGLWLPQVRSLRVISLAEMMYIAQAQAGETPNVNVVSGSAGGGPDRGPVASHGCEVRLKAPLKRHTASAEHRLETARQRMGELHARGLDGTEVIVPFGGGLLPPEELDVTPGTVVLPEYVPGLSGADGQVNELASDDAIASPDVVIRFDGGGGLPEEVTSPPAGVVVGLLAPPSPIENADLERDSQSTELDFGRYVLDVPYSGANLAAELLDPPEGTTLRLEAPLGEIEVFGTSDWTSRMTEEGDANKAVKEMVMPFKKQRGLPWYEASPPADTVIKLRASAD